MMSLVRGFVDDEDLTAKLHSLYQVQRATRRLQLYKEAEQVLRLKAARFVKAEQDRPKADIASLTSA